MRAAWGIFYDALAGQGDFFQSGTLAPPFQPLDEVNFALNAGARTSRTRSRAWPAGPPGFPAGPDLHRLGQRLPDAVRASLQPHRAAADRQQPGRRGRLRRLARPSPADLHGGQSHRARSSRRRRATGPRVFPAYSLVRPTFSEAEVLVRLAAGERPDAAHARPQLPRRLHLGPRHRSRLRAQHRRRRPAPAAARRSTIGDDAPASTGAGPREGRRDLRRAAPLRRQLRLRSCRGSRTRARS